MDITRRHDLEEALVGASEAVRRDIGRELHDVLSSDLAALAMKADNLLRRLRGDGPSSRRAQSTDQRQDMGNALEEIVEGIRAAATQSRNLSHVLMPVTLQKESLATALQQLCREQAELGEPAPLFEGDRSEVLPESKETAMHLYRIAREAITNAQRHADAHRIGVRLARMKEGLVLQIRDDGTGLPETTGSQEESGIGLQTMKHRADLIGATLTIESSEEGGTVVRCTLPMPKALGE